jgi:hypothetical protein
MLFVDDAWPFVVHSIGFCIRFGWNEKQNCWQFIGEPDAGTGRPFAPSEPAAVALARSGAPRKNPDENRKRGVTNKRVSNRKLKMELGHQFKYPNFRKGYSAELLRLGRAAS